MTKRRDDNQRAKEDRARAANKPTVRDDTDGGEKS
jgi:hypothetical protein